MIKWFMGLQQSKPVEPEVTASEFVSALKEFEEGSSFCDFTEFMFCKESDEIRKLSRDEKKVVLWLRWSEGVRVKRQRDMKALALGE